MAYLLISLIEVIIPGRKEEPGLINLQIQMGKIHTVEFNSVLFV